MEEKSTRTWWLNAVKILERDIFLDESGLPVNFQDLQRSYLARNYCFRTPFNTPSRLYKSSMSSGCMCLYAWWCLVPNLRGTLPKLTFLPSTLLLSWGESAHRREVGFEGCNLIGQDVNISTHCIGNSLYDFLEVYIEDEFLFREIWFPRSGNEKLFGVKQVWLMNKITTEEQESISLKDIEGNIDPSSKQLCYRQVVYSNSDLWVTAFLALAM